MPAGDAQRVWFAELERSWMRHQRGNGLSRYGKPKQAPRALHEAGDPGAAVVAGALAEGPADKAQVANAGRHTCRSS